METDEKRIALLGLNSAWMCGRNKDEHGKGNDYGQLILGEPQIKDALGRAAEAVVVIAVFHHAFEWMAEFDRNRVEERLGRKCHFILCGHQHMPKINIKQGTSGDCVLIPAGASYYSRMADDPRYTSSYNFVHLDFATGQGVVHLRRWSERKGEWIKDTDSLDDGQLEFALPKDLGSSRIMPSAVKPTPTPPEKGAAAPSPLSRKDKKILKIYLEALIRDTRDLDPGGIRQTYKKATSAMPLDKIYVGLQADRDRPDVDRRVMQEELDEIKKRLEKIEDAQERERQYQLWATQARVIQQAIDLTDGERVELSDLARRHRLLVILGDPGSGKTTLQRYMALRLAQAVLDDVDRLFEERDWWDYENSWRLPDLGAVRLPLLMRISRYAEARKEGADPDLALVDYLARYFVGHLQLPCTAEELAPVLRRCMDSGRCLVLLDGLDEIIDPADRREIAANVSRFAGSYGMAGLPDWTSRPLRGSRADDPTGRSLTYDDESDSYEWDDVIDDWQWDKRVPDEVVDEWKKRWKKFRHGARVRQMAHELLRDARSAHLGNRFVVTSRIAGYHFARVSDDFEHYTIRPMNIEDIERFLEKWCPVAERRIAERQDPDRIESRAAREIGGIMRAVREMPGVRRMAQNPLLLRILAIIHRNERHLPQRRVELYETATVTLLRDWNLERGMGMEVVIDEHRAMGLLGPIAFWIHENRPTGLLTKGEVETQLGAILAREQGDDPEKPSLAVMAAVEKFLETVRQYSGIFVERGEGLFGFMHLTFEEYFTARHMVSRSSEAKAGILSRLHQPRWREPTLLAVGFMSKNFYQDTHELLEAILDHGSEYEPVLHRDLLFAAACVGDSVNVAPVLIQDIARRLLALYMDRRDAGRYLRLQAQVKDALQSLNNEQGNEAVEAALAEVLTANPDSDVLSLILDVVEFLNPSTPAVTRALESITDQVAQSRIRKLRRRKPTYADNGGQSIGEGWAAHRDDKILARLLGTIWCYGWGYALFNKPQISKTLHGKIAALWEPLELPETHDLADQLDDMFDSVATRQRDLSFWNQVWSLSNQINGKASRKSDTQKKAHLICDYSRKFASGESIEFDDDDLKKAIVGFRQAARQQREVAQTFDLTTAIEKAGVLILADADDWLSLIPVFVNSAKKFHSILESSAISEKKCRDNVKIIQNDLTANLLDELSVAKDAQTYFEVALFLNTVGKDARLKVIECVTGHLVESDGVRCDWALQVLKAHDFRKNVRFTPAYQGLLHNLLTGPVQNAAPALDILLTLDITQKFLTWCWATLRAPDHPLAETVRDGLPGKIINGSKSLLELIDEGLRYDTLRPIAMELLRKVEWKSIETFAYALYWLNEEDAFVRNLAAIILSSENGELYAELNNFLAKAAREIIDIKTDGVEPEHAWATQCEDPAVVRLMGGMWLHGWDNMLVMLLMAQSSKQYVNKRHPDRYWRDLRTYPDNEEAVCWLLEKAKFGKSLISLFQKASENLADLEKGPPKSEPTEGNISTVVKPLVSYLAKSPYTVGFLPINILRQILSDTNHPVYFWIREKLSRRELEVNAEPSKLARLLTEVDKDIRIAAGLSIITADLPALVLRELVDAVQSSDDRIRNTVPLRLYRVCSKLPTDGSTHAVEWIINHALKLSRQECDSHLFTVVYSVASSVEYETDIVLSHMLKTVDTKWSSNGKQSRGIRIGIGYASPSVQSFLCSLANDVNQPQMARRNAVGMLLELLRSVDSVRVSTEIATSLIALVVDHAINIRRKAAYMLQWIKGSEAWNAQQALLRTARSDGDILTRVWALRSLGCILHTINGLRNADISKVALLSFLESKAREFKHGYLNKSIMQISSLSVIKKAADAQTLLDLLNRLDNLGISDEISTRLNDSKYWCKLLADAKDELEWRRYCLAALSGIPAIAHEVEDFLESPEPAIRRAAICALARIYQCEDDYSARLQKLLHNDFSILWAMIDASAKYEPYWLGSQQKESEQIADWMFERPGNVQAQLIDALLDELSLQVVQRREPTNACLEGDKMIEPKGYEGGTPMCNILTSLLANLSARLTYRSFTHTRDLANVVDLFARAARDSHSFIVRRFSILTLGNLQQFTADVADVFFDACQDVQSVYGETRTAVSKFKKFGHGSLERLTRAVSSESTTVAYHAALLLGELGVSRSEEMGREGRRRVADELFRILKDPVSKRIVYDFIYNTGGERIGPLYDVIYDALLQVVTGEALE